MIVTQSPSNIHVDRVLLRSLVETGMADDLEHHGCIKPSILVITIIRASISDASSGVKDLSQVSSSYHLNHLDTSMSSSPYVLLSGEKAQEYAPSHSNDTTEDSSLLDWDQSEADE